MKRQWEYREAAKEQEKVIKDRLFHSDIEEQKHVQSVGYLYEIIKKDNINEYLVSGAVLWCEKATCSPVEVDGEYYRANKNGTSRLVVQHRSSVGDKAKALITDRKKGENIFPFGNCTLPLTPKDIHKIKNDPKSKIEGICGCLMNLDRIWDEYPSIGSSRFSYNDAPGITMRAGLFCLRGGWILPLTSGQEKDYINSLKTMSEKEIEFAQKYGLTVEQLVIFEEIQEYFEKYPVLEAGNTIFAFEGLGAYTGGKNKYHPDGQFGAIFVYYKDGNPNYLTKEASTLPDNKSNAVIKDGIYETVNTNHRGYQALQLREYENVGNSNIPAVRYDGRINNPDTANGINLHAAGDLYPNSGWSEGCLTVKVSEYQEFGLSVGFLDMPKNGRDVNEYKKLKEEFPEKSQVNYEGYIIVSREFMNDEDKELFFE